MKTIKVDLEFFNKLVAMYAERTDEECEELNKQLHMASDKAMIVAKEFKEISSIVCHVDVIKI